MRPTFDGNIRLGFRLIRLVRLVRCQQKNDPPRFPPNPPTSRRIVSAPENLEYFRLGFCLGIRLGVGGSAYHPPSPFQKKGIKRKM